ncbi:hypothetical protein OHA72_15975 [Dactylosporangium sp. NBC_01737]|uniref:hypothetical protein n=1 Tax=Dactylosporangium sp. NBC_01737 TaxID=2975959 RepID=UPI002E15DB8A|nr:hypothetical protein OHA72_15975 [Dactylosporangium sp. NBC_01737]
MRAGGFESRYLAEVAPWLVEAAAEIGLAAALSAALLHRGAGPRPWWGWFAAAAAGLLTVALLAWSQVEAVRATGF